MEAVETEVKEVKIIDMEGLHEFILETLNFEWSSQTYEPKAFGK